MEKLNELEMLAKFADKEVTWSLLPFDLVKDGWCVEVVDYIAAMMPANILAIAEEFRALEQRAEAAEASAKDWRNKAMNQCAKREVAESKLAELEKQEPVGWMTDVEVDELHSGVAEEAYIYAHADATSTIPLFTRPAPAINLAELVPDEMPNGGSGSPTDSVTHWCDGYNSCRAAMLRSIEEQSK